ncbi:class I SAM-dependent RNA methyltransferase, partial [Enterococcus faecalis]
RRFYDRVCGSRTICIEAALIGHNMGPGFNRSFTCETWDWVDPGIFEKVRNEAEAKAVYDVELDICDSDVDGRMIEVARANAE